MKQLLDGRKCRGNVDIDGNLVKFSLMDWDRSLCWAKPMGYKSLV